MRRHPVNGSTSSCGDDRVDPALEESSMKDDEKVHVVIGASGDTGGALVRELVDPGSAGARAVNRSGRAAVPVGVEVAAGDDRGLHGRRRWIAAVLVDEELPR
jgi:hypothetical protein